MENYQRINGLVAATFTPMYANGDINYEAVKPYADMLAAEGLSGVFVNGTTGESLSLTLDARKRLLEAWIQAADGRYKVIAHVGDNAQRNAADLAAHARQAGADAIGAMAPTFFKPSTVQDLIDFFVPVAASAFPLPFYYYNMPSMTGVSLSVPAFLHEGRKVMPNLVGTKFTSNNLMEMLQCLTLDGGVFEVLHGYDEILLSGLSLGATGGVGSTYNYIPQVYLGIMEAVRQGDFDKARVLQRRSVEMVEIIIRYGGGIRGGKAVLNLKGIPCGPCRLPLSPFSDEAYTLLKHDLRQAAFL